MRDLATGAAKRVGLEILGWTVLAIGVLALFLPGPGLLLTFAGLAILSTQYTWARRVMEPVRIKAWRGAAEGVQTMPRIIMSALAALTMLGVGVLWILDPPAPSWWPVDDKWWLFGGPAVAVTVIVSALIALGLLVFAVRRFYRQPDAVEAIDRLEEEHQARVAARQKTRRQLETMDEADAPVSGGARPGRAAPGTDAPG